ncbi:FecR domain-containing protein [Desulfovibrio ferrophilus]|uniref:Hemolysin-type calcium-binding region n=1 Tax=Desulfovibrio ferrophilus TaxID=241368 RepID=A0A2Z6B368_9BACT|nr:FecR domain-containing protein [Desulfovibrio ferrophilus]BBD09959.1 hemolysin-type calcium-binding region [Desulfovibrio ferrophilus]
MDPIGTIIAATGQITAQSAEGARPLEPGNPIYAGEVLTTGPDSSVEVKFLDDSVLSQGPNSSLTVDQYIFDPIEPSASSMLTALSKGTFRLVTGKIADNNPDGISLETPLASIGIRGTGVDLHITEAGEKYGVFQYDSLDLVVSTDQGTRFITQAGLLVDVAPSGALGAPRPYTPQEIQMFQTAAPIGSIPGLDEISPRGEEGDQGQGKGEGEGEGEGEELEEELEEVTEELEEVTEEVVEELEEVAEEMDELAEDILEEVNELGAEVADEIDEAIEGVVEAAGDTTEGEFDELADTVMDLAEGFGEVLDAFSGSDPFGATDAFGDLLAGGAGLDTIIEPVAEPATEVVEPVVEDTGDDDDDTLPASGDTVTVDGESFILQLGTDNNDTITGSSSNDMMYGRNGSDSMLGGAGDDFFIGDYHQHAEDAPTDVPNITPDSGSAGDDTMIGGAGYDQFLSGDGADKFVGYNESTDVDLTIVHTGSDNDPIEAVIFNRKLDGWDNTGTLGHNGVKVILGEELATGTAVDEWGNNDTIIGIDNIDGSLQDDSITGNSDDNDFWGDDGNDTLYGLSGEDHLGGGDGDDSIEGGADNDYLGGDEGETTGVGNDTLRGGAGDDNISGDGGNDWIEGGTGSDHMTGDAGTDTLSYEFATAAIRIDLSGSGDIGEAAGDTFNDFEVYDGSDYNDTMIGSAANAVLDGRLGNDSLQGGSGAELLDGADGIDILDAGVDSAADYFYWDDPSHGNIAESILNFDSGEDKLTFNATAFGMSTGTLDGTTFSAQAFGGAYGGSAAMGSGGPYFAYDTDINVLYYDANGDTAGGAQAIAVFTSVDDPLATDMEIVSSRADVEIIVL